MNDLEYSLKNFEEVTSRPEYIAYATGNPYAEMETKHALNVAELACKLWEMKFKEKAPVALQIAGWYHDFDRMFPPEHSNDQSLRTKKRMIDTQNIPNELYGKSQDEVKRIHHPENCAAIFREYNPLLSADLQSDVSYLIGLHERGDEIDKLEPRVDAYTNWYNLNVAGSVLCEADGLSFFGVILPSYVKNCYPKEDGERRVREKIKFSYNKLSEEGKTIVKEMNFSPVNFNEQTVDLQKLVDETISAL